MAAQIDPSRIGYARVSWLGTLYLGLTSSPYFRVPCLVFRVPRSSLSCVMQNPRGLTRDCGPHSESTTRRVEWVKCSSCLLPQCRYLALACRTRSMWIQQQEGAHGRTVHSRFTMYSCHSTTCGSEARNANKKYIRTLCENEPFVVRSFTLRRAHAVVRSFVRSLIRDSVTSWCREYQVNFFFFFFLVGLESRILKGNECAF